MLTCQSHKKARRQIVVVQHSRARQARIAAALAAALFASASVAEGDNDEAARQAGQYSISTPGLPLVGFATSTSVTIDVSGPSAHAIEEARLLLNGKDVSSSLHAGSTPASLTGAVSGLQQGVNTFELIESRESHRAVARLV